MTKVENEAMNIARNYREIIHSYDAKEYSAAFGMLEAPFW